MRFVYLCCDGRFVYADGMRCWIFFRCVVMETNIWLKAFSTVTMMSRSPEQCAVKRLYGIFTILSSFLKTFFHSSSLNKNLKVRVLTAAGKTERLIIRWFIRSSTMSHFLLELKYFLWNTGALPHFAQLPSKLWEMRSTTPLRWTGAHSH